MLQNRTAKKRKERKKREVFVTYRNDDKLE